MADLQNPKTASKAFDVLMRTYGENMYWQIRRMVGSHEDADDLLQNSLIKAWNNINNFRGEAKLSTWLHKIAVNEALNFLSKERTRRGLTGDGEDSSFVMENIQADPYFDGNDVQKKLLKVISTLPEKQRLVFNMRYYDDMKYEQISDILGTSVGALKASYHHAVKKITQAFS